MSLPLDISQIELFRARGNSERELTLRELILLDMNPAQSARLAATPAPGTGSTAVEVTVQGVSAELHGRLVYVFSSLLMPFLAVPFGIVTMRSSRVGGLVVGTALLIAYHKALEFTGKYVAAAGPRPALALWGVFSIFAFSTFIIFVRTIGATGATPFQVWEELALNKAALLKKWVAVHFFKNTRGQFI